MIITSTCQLSSKMPPHSMSHIHPMDWIWIFEFIKFFRQLQSYLQYKVTIYQINIIILCRLAWSIHKSNAWRLYGPGKAWWWEWMKMRMTCHLISYILHTHFKYQQLRYMSITNINRRLILNLWRKKVWQIDKIGWIYLLCVTVFYITIINYIEKGRIYLAVWKRKTLIYYLMTWGFLASYS